MAALEAIEQDSRILTQTSLSLDIMRLVGISHTVLVLFNFGKKNKNIVLDYINVIRCIGKIELHNEMIVSLLFREV